MTITEDPSSTAAPTSTLDRTLPAVMVHRAFRREFRLAGDLVRRVPEGDVARAGIVAAHLDILLGGLCQHHQLEDDLLWPPILERAPHAAVAVIDVMQDQHTEIDRLVRAVAWRRAVWAAEPSPSVGQVLAEHLDELHRLLIAHLDHEEAVVLPMAEAHLTADEWRAVSERAEAQHAGRARILTFGMLQHEGDPAALASMLASAPLPVRLLVPRLARRAYRRHAIAVHGTPAP